MITKRWKTDAKDHQVLRLFKLDNFEYFGWMRHTNKKKPIQTKTGGCILWILSFRPRHSKFENFSFCPEKFSVSLFRVPNPESIHSIELYWFYRSWIFIFEYNFLGFCRKIIPESGWNVKFHNDPLQKIFVPSISPTHNKLKLLCTDNWNKWHFFLLFSAKMYTHSRYDRGSMSHGVEYKSLFLKWKLQIYTIKTYKITKNWCNCIIYTFQWCWHSYLTVDGQKDWFIRIYNLNFTKVYQCNGQIGRNIETKCKIDPMSKKRRTKKKKKNQINNTAFLPSLGRIKLLNMLLFGFINKTKCEHVSFVSMSSIN